MGLLRKSIVVRAPIMSRSGYGEQARFALRALRTREDLFEIFLLNIPWGHTGQISELSDERKWIEETLIKTSERMNLGNNHFDISLQITVPSEFEKISPVNIGYTAGIETNRVAHEWITKSNENIDKIITVANHGKDVFEATKYDVSNSETGETMKGWGLTVPVVAVNYAIRCQGEAKPLDIELTTSKNFLCVSQWGPAKM